MIERKFGLQTREHILNMIKTPLRRRIIEDPAHA